MKTMTASVVEGIAKMKKTTNRNGKVRQILHCTFNSSTATRYGHLMQDVARQEYLKKKKQQQQETGQLKLTVKGLVLVSVKTTRG